MNVAIRGIVIFTFFVTVFLGHKAIAQENAHQPLPSRLIRSDTWGGTDALGRTLPGYQQVGPPTKRKTVGIFYFLTATAGGLGPFDNTQILKDHPTAMESTATKIWGPLNQSHYWGKPIWGYAVSDDTAVLQKDAEMLSDAGVDTIIIDNSNAVTYDQARNKLFSVWEKIRQDGGKTPQIVFLCPFSNSNGMGTATLNELYDTVYKVKRDPDLWFRWQGKPLVLAAPDYADPLLAAQPVPIPLKQHETLGQVFRASHNFVAVGGSFPTWNTSDSGFTLSLYQNSAAGKLMARQILSKVPDNAVEWITSSHAFPQGVYDLVASRPIGTVGWWSFTGNSSLVGKAEKNGVAVAGERTLGIRYSDASAPTILSPNPLTNATPSVIAHARALSNFFTFRTPIGPYNLKHPPRDSWAWLQIFPQAPQRSGRGKVEEVAVGVAQNYNTHVNGTAPMSFPGAFGRSYHDGHEDTAPGAVDWGYNFAQQWKRARQLDPPFVFVTGWNEWTAGFYREWSGFSAPPPVFVDEFDEEDSRDIQPMAGGHGADYYYQLVSEIRRYKGVHALMPIHPEPISMDGNFSEWAKVRPDFRTNPEDAMERDAPGVGDSGPYVNHTGRNQFSDAKVSYDKKYIYFYVKTAAPISQHNGSNWMLLFIDTGNPSKAGWLGYDFVLDRSVGRTTCLQKNIGGRFQWSTVAKVNYIIRGNQMEAAVPRNALDLMHLPVTIGFKWADNCLSSHPKASDFTVNGDAAPPCRFYFRARLN